jgi:hypothetical protein
VRARVLFALAGALLAFPVVPAMAQGPAATKVFEDFATDGRISPCKHSSEALRGVQNDMPPDIEQYAPDYPAAVAAALEARARGECLPKKQVTPATAMPAAPSATPVPAEPAQPGAAPASTVVPEPPQPETAPASAVTPSTSSAADVALERAATARAANDAPLAVLLLAAVALLLAAFAAFLFAAHRMGIAERPRHAWREAAWRTTGLWEDFKDWLRLGR